MLLFTLSMHDTIVCLTFKLWLLFYTHNLFMSDQRYTSENNLELMQYYGFNLIIIGLK